jgi:hypothetical protein
MFCAVEGCCNDVDIFDAISGRWSAALLSVGRGSISAASLPNQGLAIFAGGSDSGCDLHVIHIFIVFDSRLMSSVHSQFLS